MKDPLVSFFFATLNRKPVVRETLQKLNNQTYKNFEITVCDNCSTDGTPDMIEEEFPDVKLIRLTRNHGAIAARNIACVNTKGRYVVSIDDDSFPGRNVIQRMVHEFESDPKLGLIVFDIYNYDLHIKHYDDEKHIPKEREAVEKYNWSGCGGAYRRAILEQHGYWEEWGREAPFESSVSAKAMLMGYTARQFSDIYVFHHWSSVGDPAQLRVSDIAQTIACRSTVLFLLKFFPLDMRMLGLLFKIAWISLFHFIETGSSSLLRGFLSAWTKAPHVIQERTPLRWDQAKRLSLSFNFKGH
ncbi:MAG: glycosyltransferase family 2 protein [bacterium]